MPGLIIICGLARSGTNSVSAYLHLNDKIMMFQGGPRIEDLDPHWAWISEGTPQRLAGPWYTEKLKQLCEVIDKKNQAFMKNPETAQLMYIGRRAETTENHPHLNTLLENFKVKFVYCMRKDISKLFSSQLAASYSRSIEVFIEHLLTSYRAACKLKQRGLDIWPVDVSENSDLGRLDTFLGVEPCSAQVWWQGFNPQTNQRAPDKDIFTFTFKDSFLATLIKEYDKTWGCLSG